MYRFLVKMVKACFPAALSGCSACWPGSLPAGRTHLHLPPAQPGDPLRLLPARLHHPSFPEPRRLRLSGRALQEVLDPVPVLPESERPAGLACGAETTSGGMKPARQDESLIRVLTVQYIRNVISFLK